LKLSRFFALLFCFAICSTANAAPLDKAANKKIDEAINTHYLGTDFQKAIGVLEGTVEACGERCSNAVLARAYMYIGIVKGAGLQDQEGAQEAFATALALDPNVTLDKDLATDELVQLFESAGGESVESAVPPSSEEETPVGISGGEGLECTPAVAELEVRRPVPVSCRGSQPATKAVLYYKEFGAPSYTKVTMSLSGSDWRATIPCGATALQGELKWFVTTSGGGGDLESYGAETEPNVIQVVMSTSETPPAFPGESPPAQCADAQDCPEEMRGTPTCPDIPGGGGRGSKSWGAGCERSKECEQGLYCLNGSCESPPSCETGADCDSGICEDFLCKIVEDGEGGGSASTGAPKNLLSVSFGMDFTSLSGQYVCSALPVSNATPAEVNPVLTGDVAQAAPSGFTCYIAGKEYVSHPYSNAQASGTIPSTLATGTMRAYVSYERLFTENIGAEVQAGLAFNGAPKSGLGQLVHAAAFGKYWFTGTGNNVNLYGALGGGLGQVDASESVTVTEERLRVTRDPANPYAGYSEDAYRSQWSNLYCPAGQTSCDITPVQAYKSFGQVFVGAGLGAMFNFGTVGLDVRVVGKFMLPETAVVIQPTGGLVLPF
jgi:hypothetical protein